MIETMITESVSSPEGRAAAFKIEFAEAVYCAIKARGINQSELAREMGVNRAYVSRVLKGSENLTIDTISKFCNFLAINIQIMSFAEIAEKQEEIETFRMQLHACSIASRSNTTDSLAALEEMMLDKYKTFKTLSER